MVPLTAPNSPADGIPASDEVSWEVSMDRPETVWPPPSKVPRNTPVDEEPELPFPMGVHAPVRATSFFRVTVSPS